MATTIRDVAIVGASGLLGESIIKALQAEPSFNITIISRQSSTSTFSDLKVHKLSDDYPEDELVTAFQGQDAVIVLLPTKHVHEQMRIVDAAVKAGVKRYIPSEFGLNDVFKPLQDLIWTSRNKGAVIEYLKSKEVTGMSWTAIASGSWVDWGLERNFLGVNASPRTVDFWDEGTVKFSTTALATSGLAVIRVLQAPEKTANKFLYIRDWTISQRDLVEVLERLSGETWEKRTLKSAELISNAKARLENGDKDAVFQLIKSSFLVEGLKMNFERDEVLANDLLGLPELSLDEVVASVLKKH